MAQSFQDLIVTNYGLLPSGYTGSQGIVGYTGSAGTGSSTTSTTIYANVSSLPSAGIDNGTLAYVSQNNSLYVQSDNQWKRVYTGSDAPLDVVTDPPATALIDFTANSVQQHSITFAAIDPEGFPVTYDYAVNPANSVNIQSVTNNSGNYTLQVTANSSTIGSAIFRMNATDGLHVVSRYQTLNFILAQPINMFGGTGGGQGTTVYTAPNGTVVTATDITYGSEAYSIAFMFNNSITVAGGGGTYWLSNSAKSGSLTFNFSNSSVAYLYSMVVYPRTRDDSYTSVTNVQISTNGFDWTTLPNSSINVTSATPFGFNQTFVLNTQTHKYVRLNLTVAGSWGMSLDDVRFTGA